MTTTNLSLSATRLLGAAVILSVACMADIAHAVTKKTREAQSSAASAPKKSRSVKIKQQQNHSGETTAERDRRLYRECKGMPNAGACLGYTSR